MRRATVVIGGSSFFQCRVEHRFSEEAFTAAQFEGVESARWMAVRALEGQADFVQHVARRSSEAGRMASARQLAQDAHAAAFRAEVTRRLLQPVFTSGDSEEPSIDEGSE